MCDMLRLKMEHPAVAKMLEDEISAQSSEALEILHGLVGRARTRVDKIRFRDVRVIYRSITPEMLRTLGLQRTFQCVRAA